MEGTTPEVWSHVCLFLNASSLQSLSRASRWFRSLVFRLSTIRVESGKALKYGTLERLSEIKRVLGVVSVSSFLELEIVAWRLEGDLEMNLNRQSEEEGRFLKLASTILASLTAVIGSPTATGTVGRDPISQDIWNLFRDRVRRFPESVTVLSRGRRNPGYLDERILSFLDRYLSYKPGELVINQYVMDIAPSEVHQFIQKSRVQSLFFLSPKSELKEMCEVIRETEVQDLCLMEIPALDDSVTRCHPVPSLRRLRFLGSALRLIFHPRDTNLGTYPHLFPNLERDETKIFLVTGDLEATISKYLQKFPHIIHLKILATEKPQELFVDSRKLLEASESEFCQYLGMMKDPGHLLEWGFVVSKFPTLTFEWYLDL